MGSMSLREQVQLSINKCWIYDTYRCHSLLFVPICLSPKHLPTSLTDPSLLYGSSYLPCPLPHPDYCIAFVSCYLHFHPSPSPSPRSKPIPLLLHILVCTSKSIYVDPIVCNPIVAILDRGPSNRSLKGGMVLPGRRTWDDVKIKSSRGSVLGPQEG